MDFEFLKSEKFGKYLLYFLNLALFVALLVYATKYYSTIVYTFSSVNLFYLGLAFVILLFIWYISGFKWYMLMKIFNKEIHFTRFLMIFLASNLYKYIPPKGVNYLMRYKFCKKFNRHLDGKISTMFAEFFSELYIAAVCFLILMVLIVDYNIWALVIAILALTGMTLFMFFPKLFSFIPFRFVKKLIFQFRKIRGTKAFYYSFLVTFFVALFHGLGFYLVILGFGSSISFVVALFIFYSSQFFTYLFFSPAGIGVRDVTLVGILYLLEVDPALAITIVLSHRILIFVSELVLGVPFVIYLNRKLNS
ncbi:flippase-like domain-containing protein [archaeon]|jgi:glycosyltransferase 2 family protein|nr:flippase-like domain-containing protein [archaeon]MBT4396841.1 flippase-like domain-containing protein [archaeon]MBT4441481.1 flippase-like domain-containing protein [archaeon]